MVHVFGLDAAVAGTELVRASRGGAFTRQDVEWLVPGESKVVVGELANFLANKQVVGWLLAGTMIFFSGGPL